MPFARSLGMNSWRDFYARDAERGPAGKHVRPGSHKDNDPCGWLSIGGGPVMDGVTVGTRACRSDPRCSGHPAEQVVRQFELWRDHHEQAHLSTEQPPPGQGPRIPPTHAHPRGAGDLVRSSPQGTRRAVGLTSGSRRLTCLVLPGAARLRTAADFAAVIRGGRRAGTRRLVVHLLPTGRQLPPRAGFVVSGKVGNSVVRHRVIRRLRPLVREQLNLLGAGHELVIRALPSAAAASSAELGLDLRSGLVAAMRKTRSAGSRAEAGRRETT